MLQKRLIETAIEQFGRSGYDGASTRQIARASGTAMSSITYHFGGKEGLYLACADYIAEQIAERQSEVIALGQEELQLTRAEAVELALTIVDGFAMMMLGPETSTWSTFVVREQQNPTDAFERLFGKAMGPTMDGFQRLLEFVRPDLPRREMRALAMLIFGQALVLRSARATVCRVLDVQALGSAEVAMLRAQIRTNCLAIFDGAPAEAGAVAGETA